MKKFFAVFFISLVVASRVCLGVIADPRDVKSARVKDFQVTMNIESELEGVKKYHNEISFKYDRFDLEERLVDRKTVNHSFPLRDEPTSLETLLENQEFLNQAVLQVKTWVVADVLELSGQQIGE